ncbi:MAG: hypothetical protein CVV50_00430, partial [Spirochaetae bacterium HGW-Spirochaetae-6]
MFFLWLINTPSSFGAQEVKTPFYDWSVQLELGAFEPLGYYRDKLDSAYALGVKAHYNAGWLDHLFWDGEIGYVFSDMKMDAAKKFSIVPLGSGFSYFYPLSEDFFLDANAGLGFFMLNAPEGGIFYNFYTRVGTGIFYSINYHLQVGLIGNYQYFHDPEKGISSLEAKAAVRYVFGDPASEKDLFFKDHELYPVFASNFLDYLEIPVGAVTLRNQSAKPLKRVQVFLEIEGLSDGNHEKGASVDELIPGAEITLPLRVLWKEALRYQKADLRGHGFIVAHYTRADGSRYQTRKSVEAIIYGRNKIIWDKLAKLGTFISFNDPALLDFSREALRAPLDVPYLYSQWSQLLKIAQALKSLPLEYVKDPGAAFFQFDGGRAVVDHVQYPRETLSRQGGDCDDSSVLLASLLEGLGMKTALVSKPSHVMLLVETGLEIPELTVEFEGRSWIALETTLLKEGLIRAWIEGKRNFPRAGEPREIVATQSALELYSPLEFKERQSLKSLTFDVTYK